MRGIFNECNYLMGISVTYPKRFKNMNIKFETGEKTLCS